MSTLAAQLFSARFNGAPLNTSRVVPPPSDPMAVARAMVKDIYSTRQGLVLRDHRGDFFWWDGTRWPDLATRDVRATAYQWLEHATYIHPKKGAVPFEPRRRTIGDVIDATRAIVLVDSGIEAPAWTDGPNTFPATEMISLENGLLHGPSRTLLPHTPAFFVHHSLPFPFVAQAPAPERLLHFLRELWPQDESSITALQEVFGYILGGDTGLQKIFLLVGPKRSGKGTIGRVLTGLLGAHHVAAPTLASLQTNFGLQPLIGKPLALVSDARMSAKADSKIVVERLLSVSGEDSLTIDRKYRDPWTGRLPTRFVVLTNELPRLSDSSGALASRFIMFVLTRSFYGRENPRLTGELLAEAPAIFNWALEGLDRLNQRGHFVNPDSGAEAIQQLEDLSSPIGAFIRDICVIGNYEVEVDVLWGAWKGWCERENRHPGTKAVFCRDLRAAVPGVKRQKPRRDDDRVNVYTGIGLREQYSGADPGPRGPNGPTGRPGPGGPGSRAFYPPPDDEARDGRF